MTAPWNSGLPVAVELGGEEYSIRSDYRAALDIFLALSDIELSEQEKAYVVLTIFYEKEIPTDLWQEALNKCFWFLRGGEEEKKEKSPKLVSWEQDFNMIAAPISKIVGQDIRGMEYLHWWTFLSAYMGIGDCLFAQVVRIRDLKTRGKKMDKQDREFYRRNRDLIDIKVKTTDAEEKLFAEWM